MGEDAEVSQRSALSLPSRRPFMRALSLPSSLVRALDEFKRHLVLALEDQGVKQSLQECIAGTPFREQFLEALDLPEVREKLASIRKR